MGALPYVQASEKTSFKFLALSRVRTVRPKLGDFSKFSKCSFFCCFTSQLQQWSLCQYFRKNSEFQFFQKIPSNQISLRGRFVFKTNKMILFINSYKDPRKNVNLIVRICSRCSM